MTKIPYIKWLHTGLFMVVGSFAVIYIFWQLNDCPPSTCVDPIAYRQRRANAWVHAKNRDIQLTILDHKEHIPALQQDERCFRQDEDYISICQPTNLLPDEPKAFNYAFSRKDRLKSYVGGIFVSITEYKKKVAQQILCEATVPGTQEINPPIDAQTCGEGTIQVKGKVIP